MARSIVETVSEGLRRNRVAMGMCAVRGHMLKSPAAEEDCERTPRSTTSGSSGSSYDSCSSQELLSDEVRDYFEQADPGALWQRTISRGRRCRPLSFSGIITYDIAGNQVPTPTSQDPLLLELN